MTYVLTIYFIFAFGVASTQKLTPDLATCKAEGESLLSQLDLPPSTIVGAKCAPKELGIEV